MSATNRAVAIAPSRATSDPRPNGNGGNTRSRESADDISILHSRYAPEEFVIPPVDSKGHGDRVTFRLQFGYTRQVKTIVQSKKFPFTSPGAFYRWAIHHAIKTLERMEPVPSVTAQVEMMNEVVRGEIFQQEFISMFQACSTTVHNYLGTGARGEAVRLVATLRSHIDRMPEGYWQDKYRKELDDKFGYLLEMPAPDESHEGDQSAARRKK